MISVKRKFLYKMKSWEQAFLLKFHRKRSREICKRVVSFFPLEKTFFLGRHSQDRLDFIFKIVSYFICMPRTCRPLTYKHRRLWIPPLITSFYTISRPCNAEEQWRNLRPVLQYTNSNIVKDVSRHDLRHPTIIRDFFVEKQRPSLIVAETRGIIVHINNIIYWISYKVSIPKFSITNYPCSRDSAYSSLDNSPRKEQRGTLMKQGECSMQSCSQCGELRYFLSWDSLSVNEQDREWQIRAVIIRWNLQLHYVPRECYSIRNILCFDKATKLKTLSKLCQYVRKKNNACATTVCCW